jgi:hypothetical protein
MLCRRRLLCRRIVGRSMGATMTLVADALMMASREVE